MTNRKSEKRGFVAQQSSMRGCGEASGFNPREPPGNCTAAMP